MAASSRSFGLALKPKSGITGGSGRTKLLLNNPLEPSDEPADVYICRSRVSAYYCGTDE